METRVQPELVLKRRICTSCGRGTFEFVSDTHASQEYTCSSCSA